MPTLPDAIKKENLIRLISTNGGCELPCWWGIHPGDPLKQALSLSKLLGKNPTIYDNQYTYNISLDKLKLLEISVIFWEDKGRVKRIEAAISELGRLEDYRVPYSQFVMMNLFLAKNGMPTDVLVYIKPKVEPTSPIGYILTLIYENESFAIEYYGTVDSDKPVQICLVEAYNIHLRQITFYIQDPTAMVIMRDELLEKGYETIEDVMGISLDDFFMYYSKSESDGCIETSPDIWK